MIIYEDKNILAINKPAGLLVHKADNTKQKTLVDWIIQNYPEIKQVGDEPQLRPGIVHRLDRDTSGTLIIAKNQKTFEYLKKQFAKRKIKKTYIALAKGEVQNAKGTINLPIGRSPSGGKKLASENARGKLREAITEYKVLKKFEGPLDSKANYTLLEVYPKTGRTHQIRVHLKAIGHPVVCDKLYGNKKELSCLLTDKPFSLNRHFLHAKSLELKLPDGGKIKLENDLPDDLIKVLNNLKKYDKN